VFVLPHGAALCAQCQVEKKAAQLAYQRHYQPGITDRVQMEGQRRRSGKEGMAHPKSCYTWKMLNSWTSCFFFLFLVLKGRKQW